MRQTITANQWAEISSSSAIVQNISKDPVYIVVSSETQTDGELDGIKLNPYSKQAFHVETDEKIYAICEYASEVEVVEVVPAFGYDGTTERPILTDTLGNLNSKSVNSFYLDVARGLISGHSYVEKFGENPEITTATDPEDVWDGGGIYIFSSTADIDKIASSDDGDTQDILIYGLDENWNEISQTVTLTGQTPVTLETALIRVYRMINMGSSDISGIVYLAVNGATFVDGVPDTASEIRAIINNGNNQTLMCIYSVPAGKTAYFLAGYIALSKGASNSSFAEFSWRARLFGGVFALKSKINIQSDGNSSWSYAYPIPVSLPEKSDILIRCDQVGATFGVSGGFTILLIDN